MTTSFVKCQPSAFLRDQRCVVKMFAARLLVIVLLLFLCAAQAAAQTKTRSPNTTLTEFMNDRLGMFIHWGPVSLRGTEIGWSRNREVTQQDYDSLYREFNPVLFDADAWVQVAKDAGMKYLTITARHHDGFCLWPTAYTNYSIANSPYKKDIIGALAEACKKQNMKFCIYYSVLDWYNTDYPIRSSYNPAIDPAADMNRYITFMKNQLKELITGYDPYMLWFDGAWESPWTEEMGRDMYAYLKKLKPGIVINNRLGKEIAAVENKSIDVSRMIGDYDTPEQVVGRLNMVTPWESCFTLCNQWAWKPNDAMKSLQQCLSIISRTAGGNGNLLLNVGPMPDGRIEARQVVRLKEIGQWLEHNGEAVYNTRGGPYQPADSYATTRKGNRIYVHILDAAQKSIVLKNIRGRKVVKSFLRNNSPVLVVSRNDFMEIVLPSVPSDSLPYVVTLEFNGNVESVPVFNL